MSGLPPKTIATWPPRIEVGDRVHGGISSPDTGIIIKITKNRRWATVEWDKNGTRRFPMDRLFSVTRSLTEWNLYRQGRTPCPSCGYDLDGDGQANGGTVCWLCRQRPQATP